MTMLVHIENEDRIEHSTDKHGNINLHTSEDVNIFPHMMPILVSTKTKVKKVNGHTIQAFGTEVVARKYFLAVPSGVFFPEFGKEIKVPLINYGNDVVRLKKGQVIAQFRLQPILDVNINNVGDKE